MTQDWQINNDIVSVMVPAYNAADTIVDTLESVWMQTYRPIQLIIIDDGSLDQTESIIREWASGKASSQFEVIVRTQSNRGLIKTRKQGIELSIGQYLQFLDADDMLHPEKFALCVPLLAVGDVDVVVARTDKISRDAVIRECVKNPPQSRPWLKRQLRRSTLTSNWWHSVGPLFHRRVVTAAGELPDDVHPVAEELAFHGRVKLLTTKIAYIDNVLNYYRKGRSESITGTLHRLYEGRIEGAHIARSLLKQYKVNRIREWWSLFYMCLQTYYQVVCCANDNKLVEKAWGALIADGIPSQFLKNVTALMPRRSVDMIVRVSWKIRGAIRCIK